MGRAREIVTIGDLYGGQRYPHPAYVDLHPRQLAGISRQVDPRGMSGGYHGMHGMGDVTESGADFDAWIIAPSGLNFRDGPGPEFTKLGAISPGEHVVARASGTDGWLHITWGSQEGYAKSEWISTTGYAGSGAAPAPAPFVPPPDPPYVPPYVPPSDPPYDPRPFVPPVGPAVDPVPVTPPATPEEPEGVKPWMIGVGLAGLAVLGVVAYEASK